MAMNERWCYCDGEGRLDRPRPTRRAVLAAGLAGGVWWLSPSSALAQATFASERRHDHVLVVIFLRGGADALNLVVPYGEAAYHRARPTLAIGDPKSKGKAENLRALDLDGFFGLNAAMAALYPKFREGKLAMVHAVGSGDRTRSHFEAMSVMERGQVDAGSGQASGWLARHLTSSPGPSSPMRGVAIGRVMPDSLMGATHALALESLDEFRLEGGAKLHQDLLALYSRHDDAVSEAGRNTLNVLDTLNRLNPRAYQPSGGATYPDSRLGRALRQVAFLVKNDLGMEVAALESDGWDSHVTQGVGDGWVWELAKDLGDGVAAFLADLGKESDRVTVVVQSEFGRRLQENSGFGTDHGVGGFMMLAGGGVRGGKVYGAWPGLEPDELEPPGDLRVTTDYRSVLAEVLQTRLLHPDVGQVFPGVASGRLGIVA